MPVKFTESERAYFSEMRGLTTDEKGNEVLVGLSADETDWYMAHSRRFLKDRDHDRAHKKKYLELHEKYEHARLQVLGAEHELRTENPSKH